MFKEFGENKCLYRNLPCDYFFGFFLTSHVCVCELSSRSIFTGAFAKFLSGNHFLITKCPLNIFPLDYSVEVSM